MHAPSPLPVDFMTRQPTPPSSRIIDDATMHRGWFDAPFAYPDVRADRSRLRYKEWQFISLTSEKCVIGFSIVNVGYLSNFFLYTFDFASREYREFEDKAPGGRRASLSANSLTGVSTYRSPRCTATVENDYARRKYRVVFDCADKDGHRITADLTIHARAEPVVNIREVKPGRLVYTHQSTMYRPEGIVTTDGHSCRFDPARDFAGFDFTKGRHLYETRWNWAAAGGVADDGAPVAIDFSSATGVFYWIGDALYRVKDISFRYGDMDKEWRLSSSDGSLDLTFAPCGKRVGTTNILGLLVSEFSQPFGTFSGTIRTPEGRAVRIGTLRGVTEEHLARW